jgi:hypothetical protein
MKRRAIKLSFSNKEEDMKNKNKLIELFIMTIILGIVISFVGCNDDYNHNTEPRPKPAEEYNIEEDKPLETDEIESIPSEEYISPEDRVPIDYDVEDEVLPVN